MNMTTFIFALSLSFLLCYSSTAVETSSYTPTEHILLDCGSPINKNSTNYRGFWQADSLSNFIPSNADQISELSSFTEINPPNIDEIPYQTARIINSEFTFTFPNLSVGSKFLRLYFYPASYTTKNNQVIFKKNESFFSVKANQYTLLQNFSALLNIPETVIPSYTLIKEYIINIDEDNQELKLSFLPCENSFSFVNGIEIVSIPDNLYYRGDNPEITLVPGKNQFYYLKNGTALETMYRLNVGSTFISATEDTGMFRRWFPDNDYIFGGETKGLSASANDVPVNYTSSAPFYSAPKLVYTSARFMIQEISLLNNLTWFFNVDSGNSYLLRLYFCEFFLNIQKVNDRVFSIFINNRTAEERADVILWGDSQPKVAVFKDYVVIVPDIDGRKSKQELWLSMHPNTETKPDFHNVLLNGLEIFKLSSSNNSFAAPNPPPSEEDDVPRIEPTNLDKKKSRKIWPMVVAVCGGAAALVMGILGFLIFRRLMRHSDSSDDDNKASSLVPLAGKSKSSKKSVSGSSLPDNLCRNFSIEEILSASRNFDENFLIGVGGFGNVYKGFIDNGEREVAIKRLNQSSEQGEVEFLTEIKMLSKLRHLHLVPLIGYCVDDGEMILVYDYMAHGNLREHLYKSMNPNLPWKKRLQICIGAAKGLDYLHTSAEHSIIHRDVKSTNILLDEKWVAKISDFGLSKIGPMDGDKTHVSTAVKGSFGYLDPEYFRRKQLTEKSDVYSFGVVLFEVLCGRPALIPSSSTKKREEVSLAEWARLCHKKGTIDQIVDPRVKGEIAAESLDRFVETALKCLEMVGTERPTMNDVVWSLEFSLELQDSSEKKKNENEEVINHGAPLLVLHGGNHATTSDEDTYIFSRSLELASSSYSKSKSGDDLSASSDGFNSQNGFLRSPLGFR